MAIGRCGKFLRSIGGSWIEWTGLGFLLQKIVDVTALKSISDPGDHFEVTIPFQSPEFQLTGCKVFHMTIKKFNYY
jgi:hypothetical protein